MKYLKWAGLAAAVATFITLVVTWRMGTQHWITYHTGSQNSSGTPPNYNFWSGFGSVFPWSMGVLAGWITFIALWYRKHNCHNEKCWRLGIHQVAGGQYVVCRKHHNEITGHPHRKLSTEFLRARHLEHVASKELLQEIHRHVTALAPGAGRFPPDTT